MRELVTRFQEALGTVHKRTAPGQNADHEKQKVPRLRGLQRQLPLGRITNDLTSDFEGACLFTWVSPMVTLEPGLSLVVTH